MLRRGLAAALLVLAGSAVGTPARAAEGTVLPPGPEISVVPNSYVAVLRSTDDVRLRGVATVAAEVAASAGVTLVRTFDPILGFQIQGDAGGAALVAEDPAVSRVQHNQKMANRSTVGTPL